MSTLQTVVLSGHTLIALLIIGLVLMQRGKGADAGAAFGSGASGTVFGSRGSASFFSRATAVLATVFFVSSLALAYISSQSAGRPESLLENAPPVVDEEPSAPAEVDELPTLDEAADTPADSGVEDAMPDLEPAPDDVPPEESPQ